MTTDEQIVQLLREIRDNLREESNWQRKVIDESVGLQRLGVRWQRTGLAVGGLAILAGVLFGIFYYMGLFGR